MAMVRGIESFGRMGLAAVLCVLMVDQPLLAAGPAVGAGKPEVAKAGELQGRERVLHALNRLTFGPRPGDVDTVQAMGLKRWFDLQLEPGKIDDARLDARLAQFPAMQLSIGELTSRYPGPLAIRAMESGKLPLPSDPMARAIATDEIAFYKMQKAQKAGDAALKETAGQSAENRMAAGQMALEMTAPEKPLAASEIAPETSMSDGTMVGAEAGAGRAESHEAAMALMNQPPDQRMKALLAMPAGDLAALRKSLKPRELAQLVEGMSPQQKEILIALPGAVRMVALEAMESRLIRDIYSERQLEAVMTDFWLNHFNVYVRKNGQEPYLIPAYERETIRPRALGNFEDLLVATAKSPAMLAYLDNFRSIGPDSQAAGRIKRIQQMRPNGVIAKNASAGLNENYGRELMELHTLGVGGGYTQADVTAVAKVFTGWTIDKPYQGGEFVFEERRHEPGAKVVLGKTIKEGGEREGLEVLHMLATSPATARFISTKLAVRFVSDTPDPVLVDKMTASFLASHGEIKTVLRTMFDAPEFWAAGVERAKVKTPEEFVVSAVRASGIEVNNAQGLVQSLDKLGMPLYGMQTPNGYSWMKDGWVSTGALVSRMNFALVLTDGRMVGTRTEWAGLLAGKAPVVRDVSFDGESADVEKERKLEGILLGMPVSEKTRAAVLGQARDSSVAEQAATQFDLGGAGGGKKGYARAGRMGVGGVALAPDDAQAAVMAGLLLGSPEFQRR